MKEITAELTRAPTPTTGTLIFVRDNKIYDTRGSRESFCLIGEEVHNKNYISKSGIKDTDKLYCFPKNEDIYKSLLSGICLDTFLVKNNTFNFGELRELVRSGKIIGLLGPAYGKYHLYDNIENSNIYWKSRYNITGQLTKHSNENRYYEFSDIYELGHWMYS